MSIQFACARLSDDLPFWFVMTNPLIGVLGGPLLVWLLGRAEKPCLEETIDAGDSALSLIVGRAV
jgi:uncharacterized Tic20 family protein